MRTPRLAVALVALIAIATTHSACGDKDDSSVSREQVSATGDEQARLDLQPVPDAPQLNVPQEPLPGADGKLAVVAARPQGPIAGEVRPTVTFSRPVKSLADVESQRQADKQKPFAKIEPSIEGEWHWLGSASAEFVPKAQVPYSTAYQVTVFKGLRSIEGAELAEDYSFSFQTPKPELQDVSPADGYAWIKPDLTFSLVFNQPVKDLEQHARFTVEGEAGPRPVHVVKTTSIAEERRAEEAKQGKRHVERQSFEERGFKNQQTRYELKSDRPFPLAREVVLTLDAELSGEQGPLTMGAEKKLGWKTYGPLVLREAHFCYSDYRCPTGPLALFTSNEVDLESLKSRLRIAPAVEIDWEHSSSYAPHAYYGGNDRGPFVQLQGNFQPGTRYQVEVSPGVKDVFGQVDGAGFQGKDQTDDYAPAMGTGGQNALIETAAGTKLPISITNLETLQVDIWKLSSEEVAQISARAWYDEDDPLQRPADFSETRHLSLKRNERTSHLIDLAPAFGVAKSGVALVRLRSPELSWQPRNGFRVLVQVTDLAAHLLLGPAKSLVWVTRLSGAEPVPGAAVSLYDQSGAVKWSGRTDAQGLVDVPGAVELGLSSGGDWDTPFALAAATLGADTGVASSQWSDGLSPWDFNVPSGWEGPQPDSVGFVFADRGIYRPGDKVYLKGLARYRTVGTLKAPSAGSTLSLAVADSQGNERKKLEVTVNSYGTFSAELEIPKDAPLGAWSVQASGQAPTGELAFSGSFRVEEYRAPQFKVDVQPAKKTLLAGEPLQASVFARYLFGGAMNDAKVRWSVNRATTSFTPEKEEAFSFGQETWWWDDERPAESSGLFGSGTGTVDAKGALAVSPGNVEAPGGKTYAYTLEAEVEDVNRQTVADRALITVHPSSYYVGLRPPAGFRKANEEVPVDTIVVDTSGRRVGGKTVHVEVVSRTWKSVRQKDAGGGYTTVSEPVEERVELCELTSDAKDVVPCVFKPKASGFYIARATVEDEARRKQISSIGLYVTGSGWVAWQRNDTERIDLVPDKAKYDVGETAKILIKSPYPSARALVAVEREGVLGRQVVELKGSTTTVEVPITEASVPNVYVSVLMVHPRTTRGGIESGDDPGRPSVRVGLIKLEVEKSARRLAVAIAPERDDYRPGEEVRARLSVKNRTGAGVPSELAVYVVDEAVLRLTGYHAPDPVDAIFPLRPLSVRLGEPLINLVKKRDYGEKGEDAGGGGGEGSSGQGAGFRSNFKTNVYWNPSVETRADGTEDLAFKLPDNLTEFRIMAVAITRDDRFGAGEKSIHVNKPLLALPALPRFARVGDTFEAGVVVHGHGAGTGEVTVTAQAQNAKLQGPVQKRITLTEGHPQEVRFPFLADRAGTATFRFRVVKGPDQDGVEVKIPVELPVALEAVATYGDTRDQRIEGISPPKNVRPEVGGLEVTLASTALGNFQEGFRQLVEYPYGCLEQQSSRLIPFVSLRELAPKFGIPWQGPDRKSQAQLRELNSLFRRYLFNPLEVTQEKDPDQVIRKTIASIESLQRGDGAFNYWADDWCPDSYASAYATLALARANDVGFKVNPEVLNRAQGYLSRVVGGQCSPCEWSCPNETRVMAAYVLARSGKPMPSAYGEFFSGRKDLPLFSQALLADAIFVGRGNRDQAKRLMQEILNHAKESPKGVHFEETHSQTYAAMWHSDTRTTGAVLQTLTTISPDHPYVSKIAHYLTQVRNQGKWRSTQEAAFSLIGLTEMVRTKEKDTPDFVAQALLGRNPIAHETFKGRSTAVKSVSLKMSELQRQTSGQEQKLAFKKEGTGVLYYSALLRYAPSQLPMKPLEAGLYVQRWFEPYNGGGQSKKFYAGDLVRVRLRVATNQERHFAAIEVPLPAGLEPVDTSLATTAKMPTAPDEESRGQGYEYQSDEDQYAGSAYEGEDELVQRWSRGFWSPFNHVEQRDDRVVVFADHLPPGIHVTSFVARATTPGIYLLKPASGALMYEPEVFGRSEGGTFEVLLPQEVSQR